MWISSKGAGLCVGSKVITTKVHESCAGKFTVGTPVTIIGIDNMRGYAITDNNGHKMIEIGWVI
jgi:hypothetical protein